MNRNIVWIVVLIIIAVAAFLIGKGTAVAPQQEEKAQVEKMTKPLFAGAEKHEITKEEAIKLIQNHQKAVTAKTVKGKVAPVLKGGSFNRAIIDKILAQPGCQRLRFYYAAEDDGASTIVLVGVDTTGKDMVTGAIAQKTGHCPPDCDIVSELLR